MAELVDTVIEDERWHKIDINSLAERACGAVLLRLSLDPAAFEIALLACDDTRISGLNAMFRDKSGATNVLSWPSASLQPGAVPPEELGDIALSYDTCKAEARDQGKDFGAHVTHLLVHGCLHLLGYDHISAKEAQLMEGLEVEILANLGLRDPY
jgi:probable rRNA maturation factor